MTFNSVVGSFICSRIKPQLAGVSFLLIWCLSSCNQQLPSDVEISYNELKSQVDFNFQVKPILSDKCFTCHGPDEAALKAGLRLDIRESATGRLESGEVAIKPGKAFNSHLVERILSSDPEQVMPPPDSHLKLDAQEKAILIKWIEQGAEYKPHWAFIPPETQELPNVKDKQWTRNEIDYFVLAKMNQQGFEPSERASKEILIRRLYFNLTGLPPTAAAVESFLDHQSETAYEQLIDQLMADPAYGERMAMEWMDVARYADSDGYLDDKHRDFSPWRDWVIKAFNQNMPYDQFVTWQLAGDLLPDASQESILATAFNRLHKRNSEAGIVFEEYRVEYVADRANTVGKAFLGLSMECARCHDHKYDPISQEDYYQLFAFFNSTNELGTAIYGPDQTPGPALLLSSEEQQELLDYLDKDIASLESKLEKTPLSDENLAVLQDENRINGLLKKQLSEGRVAYFSFDQLHQTQDGEYQAKNQVDGKTAALKEPQLKPGAKNQAVFINDFTRINYPEKLGWFDRTDPFSISLSVFPDTIYQDAGLLFHCEDLRLGLKGYSMYLQENRLKFIIAHGWPQNALQVRTEQPLPVKSWSELFITYDGSSRAGGIKIYLNGEEVPVVVDYDHLYKGILYEPDIHTYGFNGLTMGHRDKMKTFVKGGLDEFKIYNRELTALEVLHQYNPESAREYITNWSPTNDKLARQYYRAYFDQSAVATRSELKRVREKQNKAINEVQEIMVLGDLQESRPTFLLDRGMYDAPSTPVNPGTPANILAYDQEWPDNRLGLTKWLFDKRNPLTARVLVNRIWQMHFGRGIVETPDDFGSQGKIPTHPELLDWLALEFINSGWDIKKLHKLILMSATFQQSSKLDKELLEKDPQNEWYARGPSYRLRAEMIRDNALTVSGLLADKIGGPSVYPYQPEGLWDEISNKVWRYKYLQEPGEGLYRRSLYTIWKRTSPPPSMLIFDVGDRSVCQVKRTTTSTPLQALVLLNDPQYLEAARVLAERLMLEGDHGNLEPGHYLSQAFQRINGRAADEREMELLAAFYRDELERFSANPQDVSAYLAIGERKTESRLEPTRLAALATVISGIFNTYESYTLK